MQLFTTIHQGKFKGKKLLLPPSATTRSTKSIVAESFLNSALLEIRGAVFVECFGGSGLVAASALSVGAKHAYAVELDKTAFGVLAKNASVAGFEALYGDTFTLTPALVAKHTDVVLYLDPPFDIREGFSGIYEKVIHLVENLPKANLKMVVFEHLSSVEMPQNIGQFCKTKTRKFGKTTLSYYV